MKSTLTHSRRAARGMTLVELLVAMTIGLFLIITVVSVYITTTASSRYNVLAAQMNEDAALAIELLQENIRLAGYAGQSPAGVRNFSEIPLLGCDGGFTQASESGPFSALACNGGTQSDALAVRYEATSLNSQLAGAPPIPSNCSSNGIAPSLQGSGATISLADNRFYIANDAANAGTPRHSRRAGTRCHKRPKPPSTLLFTSPTKQLIFNLRHLRSPMPCAHPSPHRQLIKSASPGVL